MKNTPIPNKPGPRPKGFERNHIFLPPDIADWAKSQPEGLSGLVRALLAAERTTRQAHDR